MDKEKTLQKSIADYGCLAVLAGFIVYYFIRFFRTYDLLSVRPMVWVFMSCVVVFIVAGIWLGRFKKIYTVLCLCALFCIFSFRVLEDLCTSYLWAEDGIQLIQDSINLGIGSLIDRPAGSLWVIPRLIALIAYWICELIGSLALLPILQGFLCKLVAAICLLYFVSDRFEWAVKSRLWRFVVCVMVVLAIPECSFETMPCDTSLPFVLNFTVFLIGLDVVLNPEARVLTLPETVFLALMAVSTASAPFVGAVAVASLVRWCWVQRKSLGSCRGTLVKGAVCTAVVVAGTVTQVLVTMQSSREISNLMLGRRLLVSLLDFVFFPYFDSYRTVFLWVVALFGWLAVAFLARASWKLVSFCSLYGFAFLFYCSMVDEPDEITKVIDSGIGARYFMMNYMIAFFLLGVNIYSLLKADMCKRIAGIVLCIAVFLISVPTYLIGMQGYNIGFAYDYSIRLYDQEGEDVIFIPIAPYSKYRMAITCDFDAFEDSDEDPVFSIDTIDEQSTEGEVHMSSNDLEHVVSGRVADPDGHPLEYIFLYVGDGLYDAPSGHSDCDYVFMIGVDKLTHGSLRFIGISSDGELYSWEVPVNIVFD